MTGVDAEAAKGAAEGLAVPISTCPDENPAIIADYQKNDKAANKVIGFVMKQSGGQCSSAEVVETTKRLIESRF